MRRSRGNKNERTDIKHLNCCLQGEALFQSGKLDLILGGDNRPISRIMFGKKLYFLSVVFSSGGGAPLPAVILAGRSQRRNPCEVRSSLSQFPLRRASLPPTGQKTATRSSYAAVQFVNGIRSLVTDGAASRHTMSITTGFGSIADAAPIAGRPLPSFRCFLFLTRISVCGRVARRCCGALRSTVRGRRHRPS
jgi:hypothetical protein